MPSEDELMVGLDKLIGTEFLSLHPDSAGARLTVTGDLMQPFGVVHGAVLSALAESLVSRATYEAVKGEGLVAFGQSASINFLRPISEGHINAKARARHRGRTTWVWEVEISNDDGQACALSQQTIAVRSATRESDS